MAIISFAIFSAAKARGEKYGVVFNPPWKNAHLAPPMKFKHYRQCETWEKQTRAPKITHILHG